MRTSSRAHRVLLSSLVWALAAATASAQDLFYLRAGGWLSPTPPAASSTTTTLTLTIPAGKEALFSGFTSAPLEQDLVVADVHGSVYLGTGRPGMDQCARVTTSLVRKTASALTEVATGTVVTSIRTRRQVTAPIVVPMPVADQLVAAQGDRIIFRVLVANECGGERNVSILLDSISRPSAIALGALGATTTTTTNPSTTTLPALCVGNADGLAGVRCRLEAMDTIIRQTPPALLGGTRLAGRLSRRVGRALKFVRAAELIEATPRRLRKGRRQLTRFVELLSRGRGDGRVATEVGDPLGSLSQGATANLDAVIVGG